MSMHLDAIVSHEKIENIACFIVDCCLVGIQLNPVLSHMIQKKQKKTKKNMIQIGSILFLHMGAKNFLASYMQFHKKSFTNRQLIYSIKP